MSALEEQVLWDCLHGCEAWRLLHNPEVAGSLDQDAVLDLAKQAGYPEHVAQKMATDHAWEQMRRRTPE